MNERVRELIEGLYSFVTKRSVIVEVYEAIRCGNSRDYLTVMKAEALSFY